MNAGLRVTVSRIASGIYMILSIGPHRDESGILRFGQQNSECSGTGTDAAVLRVCVKIAEFS